MDKRRRSFYLTALLAIAIQCSYGNDKIPLKIIASNSIIRDMVQQISGDLAIVHTIVPVGSDPHSYDPKAGDIQLLKQADIIFMNGLHLESWLTRMIKNSQTLAPTVIVSKGIIPLQDDNNRQMIDPHAWMDVKNAQIYIKNILESLVKVLPRHKHLLHKRYEHYNSSLEDLDLFVRGLIKQIPEKNRFLVTSHDAFRYFGLSYHIEVVPLMGTSTEAEPRTSDFIRLSQFIKQFKVPTIFIESTINPVILQQLAKDLGIKVGGSLYSDSLGPLGSEAETYIKMMRYNVTVVYTGLSSSTNINKQKFPFTLSIYQQYGALVLLLLLLSLIFINILNKKNA